MKKEHVECVIKRLQEEKEEITKEQLKKKMKFVKRDETGEIYFLELKKRHYIIISKTGEVTVQAR